MYLAISYSEISDEMNLLVTPRERNGVVGMIIEEGNNLNFYLNTNKAEGVIKSLKYLDGKYSEKVRTYLSDFLKKVTKNRRNNKQSNILVASYDIGGASNKSIMSLIRYSLHNNKARYDLFPLSFPPEKEKFAFSNGEFLVPIKGRTKQFQGLDAYLI